MNNTDFPDDNPIEEPSFWLSLEFHSLIINGICIFASFIYFFLNFAICLMHIRQQFLRQGFFNVIFSKIILECFTNLIFIFINIIMIIFDESPKRSIPLIFIFDFTYFTSIYYEFLTIIYLLCYKRKSEEAPSDEPMDRVLSRDEIGIKKPTFKVIHILSFILGFLHSGFFVLFCLRQNINLHDFKWYLYFIPINANLIWTAFFAANFFYFLVSIIYLILSWNVEKITSYIRLKNFSVYCFFASSLSLVFPISRFILTFAMSDLYLIIVMYVTSVLFIVYLGYNCYFRLNCYYVQYILSKEGKYFLNRLIKLLKILFCCEEVDAPNVLDLNNSFICHSLAYISDFITEPNMERFDSSSSVEEVF